MENLETPLCLDSGIVMRILRKEKETLHWLESVSENRPLAITLLTLFELYRGAYLGSRIFEEIQSIEHLADNLSILPFTSEHMRLAAEVSVELQKKGMTIDIRDLLIGVCVREEGCILKTNNRKHFEHIPRLNLAD